MIFLCFFFPCLVSECFWWHISTLILCLSRAFLSLCFGRWALDGWDGGLAGGSESKALLRGRRVGQRRTRRLLMGFCSLGHILGAGESDLPVASLPLFLFLSPLLCSLRRRPPGICVCERRNLSLDSQTGPRHRTGIGLGKGNCCLLLNSFSVLHTATLGREEEPGLGNQLRQHHMSDDGLFSLCLKTTIALYRGPLRRTPSWRKECLSGVGVWTGQIFLRIIAILLADRPRPPREEDSREEEEEEEV